MSESYWVIKTNYGELVLDTFQESEYYSIKEFIRNNMRGLDKWDDAQNLGYRCVEVKIMELK